ncbi:hypothetical protein DS909_06935 [Phaeobacter gallaeciensis]|uniref:DUF2141 domain-containing protein n=2 Tax=Roseobacteraceae TaxID=2854170 RepID=A0A366X353_9RHOB|nr:MULTISPECIES: DUF2141 domain-containing protein [Roseobacteraceae]MBT3142599.1 DUF2141 domain-containing protein [Falsiruegeria litorea]MBT8171004.1 DUF2141 domain-containing protein [Falsiruegeria litorea]RBW58409.1 hypothetical protein DS909_06935 [Phaeobacter gallaeciensis]
MVHAKVLTSSLIAAVLSASAAYADMPVTINNVDASGGAIHVLAFNDKTAFEGNMFAKMVSYVKIPATEGTVSGTLKGLEPGTYAIMLHHDANENGQMEMKGAVPLEGWGYSNGAGATSVPTFEEASVEYTGENTAEMAMNYAP